MATEKKNPTAKEVWDTLYAINVSEHTQEKGGLTYLSWAWAWSIMMAHYPQLTIKWHGMTDEKGVTRDITTYPGGTASVCCSISIGSDVQREMWLPVMDHRNRAITNPDSRAISDAKQRCLTKCLGVLGLGAYVYAGEDAPVDAPKAVIRETLHITPIKSQAEPTPTNEEVDWAITNLKATITDLHKRGWTPADAAAKKQITSAIKGRDMDTLVNLRKDILTLAESALQLHDNEDGKNDE
jgi:hypothetical protein